jgi:hypothetical protein
MVFHYTPSSFAQMLCVYNESSNKSSAFRRIIIEKAFFIHLLENNRKLSHALSSQCMFTASHYYGHRACLMLVLLANTRVSFQHALHSFMLKQKMSFSREKNIQGRKVVKKFFLLLNYSLAL